MRVGFGICKDCGHAGQLKYGPEVRRSRVRLSQRRLIIFKLKKLAVDVCTSVPLIPSSLRILVREYIIFDDEFAVKIHDFFFDV